MIQLGKHNLYPILAGLMVLTAFSIAVTSMSEDRSTQPSTEEEKEAQRVAFCKSVIDVVTPDNPRCGKDLERFKREIAEDKKRAELQAAANAEKMRQAADPHRWKESDYPGIYWRWCSTDTGCTSDKVIGDNPFVLAQVWCKERPCGDIYAKVNLISSNGVVVGWTNDTGYGDMGQKVQLTFDSHQTDWDSVRLVELNIRG